MSVRMTGVRITQIYPAPASPFRLAALDVWRAALEGLELTGAQILKRDGGAWVARAMVGELAVVIKARPREGWLRRYFGATECRRHWRGAELLMGAGLATARPVALGNGHDGTGEVELLVMEMVDGPTLLHALAAGPGVREAHALAERAGRHVAALAGRLLFNRDGKPSNVIVAPDGKFVVIDASGVRWVGGGFGEIASRMLASLFIEPWGVGHRPRRALCMRAVRAALNEIGSTAGPKKLWRRVQAIVEAHGDPTPKVNPLG